MCCKHCVASMPQALAIHVFGGVENKGNVLNF